MGKTEWDKHAVLYKKSATAPVRSSKLKCEHVCVTNVGELQKEKNMRGEDFCVLKASFKASLPSKLFTLLVCLIPVQEFRMITFQEELHGEESDEHVSVSTAVPWKALSRPAFYRFLQRNEFIFCWKMKMDNLETVLDGGVSDSEACLGQLVCLKLLNHDCSADLSQMILAVTPWADSSHEHPPEGERALERPWPVSQLKGNFTWRAKATFLEEGGWRQRGLCRHIMCSHRGENQMFLWPKHSKLWNNNFHALKMGLLCLMCCDQLIMGNEVRGGATHFTVHVSVAGKIPLGRAGMWGVVNWTWR